MEKNLSNAIESAKQDKYYLEKAFSYADGCDGIGDAIPSAIRTVSDKIERMISFKEKFEKYIEKIKNFDNEFALGFSFNCLGASLRTIGNLVGGNFEYAEKIKEIVEVINSMDDTTSDYIYNLKILLSKKVVEYKNIAILISAFAGYNKEMKKREAVKKESETIKSEYVGNVGDKVSYDGIRAEVVGRYDTQYGVNVIYRFVIDGNILIWRTTGFINCNLPVSIRGTIKAHNDFRGVKQTELTRCRVVQ